jgi:hypothetical protein
LIKDKPKRTIARTVSFPKGFVAEIEEKARREASFWSNALIHFIAPLFDHKLSHSSDLEKKNK